MAIRLNEWLEARNFKSQDAFAKELCTRVPAVFAGSPASRRHRLLGNQLSRLKKGGTAWWRKNSQVAEVAAALLGVPLDQLLGTRGRTATDELLTFPEFPALRPLDALRESPLREAGQCKFVGDPKLDAFNTKDLFRFHYSGLVWLQAPPGAGKSLAFRYQQLRTGNSDRVVSDVPSFVLRGGESREGAPRFLQVTRLADVVLEGSAISWLVIEVEQPDPLADVENLRALARHRNVVIVAPFPRPGAREDLRLEALPRDQREALKPLRWIDYRWDPEPGWREAFIKWIAERLGAERKSFEPQELIDWLHEIDASGQLVETPGELLMLCALAHEQGTRRLKKRFAEGWKDISREWISGVLRREATDDTSRAVWLRASGADAVRALAAAAWRSGSHWPPCEPIQVWAERLPSIYFAPPPDQRLDQLLETIVSEPSRKRRAQKAREAKVPLQTLSSQMAIEYLSSTRLFRIRDTGLALRPRWMADALARELVEETLMRSPSVWGAWAARSDRRPVVESVLNGLPFPRLLEIVDLAVREFDAARLGAVGATDTLFALLGRRPPDIQGREQETTIPILQRLAQCHLGSLIQRYPNSLPVPVTRPGFREQSLAWLSDCWAWSFSLPAPAWEVPAELRWCFPGWTRPSLTHQDRESILDELNPRSIQSAQPIAVTANEDPEFARLLRWTGNVVDVCFGESFPLEVPTILLPAAMIWAARRGVDVEPRRMEKLFHSAWPTVYLASLIDEVSASELRGRLCDLVWKILVWRMQGVSGVLGGRWSPTEQQLVERVGNGVSPEAVRLSLGKTGSRGLGRVHEWMPPRLLRLIAEALTEVPGDRYFRLDVSGLGAEYVETIELLVMHSQSDSSALSALWRLAPDRALAMCRGRLAASATDAVVERLFWAVPREAWGALLGLLENRAPASEVLPAWVHRWLAHCILAGGQEQERAWELRSRLAVAQPPAP